MAANVQISETYGPGAGTTYDNIGNTNMGSTSTYNLDPVAYPITAGQNSFEKWQRIKLVALNGSSRIKNLRIWRTGALTGSDLHKCNLHETQATYANTDQASYTAATASTSTIAIYDMPTAVTTGPNLGIAGSLTGEMTTEGGYSDYLVHQLQVAGGTTAGATCTMNYQYDEIA